MSLQSKSRLIVMVVVVAVALLLFVDPFGFFRQPARISRPVPDKALIATLDSQFQTNLTPADQAALALFDKYAVVVGGYYAFGFIREEIEFMIGLIPGLAEKGVDTVAVDFLRSMDQPAINDLIARPFFDEAAARLLLIKNHVLKTNRQQLDFMKAVWLSNHAGNLPRRGLRLLGLNVLWDTAYAAAHDNPSDSQAWRKILPNGLPDENYAKVILAEVLAKKGKALVYVQRESSYAGFVEPAYKMSVQAYQIGDPRRFARILAESKPGSVATILFHTPWQDYNNQAGTGFPVNGIIDALLDNRQTLTYPLTWRLDTGPFGEIDISQTPYNRPRKIKIKDREINPPPPIVLKLKDFGALYVVLGRIHNLHTVTAIPNLVTDANKNLAAQFLPPQHPAKDDPNALNKLIVDNINRAAQVLTLFKPN